MSEAKARIFPDSEKPKDVWDIEKENFAWIDFFWSALGRSGEAGQGVETLYEKLGHQDSFKQLSEVLANSLSKDIGPRWTDWFEKQALEAFLQYVYDRIEGTEKHITGANLSEESMRRLYEYLQGPLRRQIGYGLKARDLGVEVLPTDIPLEEQIADIKMPETVFTFGHTHKPFSDYYKLDTYPNWVDVYNTGGWVVEKFDPFPGQGGAILLLDKDFNAASIRLYNETERAEPMPVHVEEAPRGFRPKNKFFEEIKKLVNPRKKPWINFSKDAANAVHVRRKHLQKRIITRK
jgi:hypothetical protein